MYFPMFFPMFFRFSEVFKVPKASVGAEIVVSSRVESLAERARLEYRGSDPITVPQAVKLTKICLRISLGKMGKDGKSWRPPYVFWMENGETWWQGHEISSDCHIFFYLLIVGLANVDLCESLFSPETQSDPPFGGIRQQLWWGPMTCEHFFTKNPTMCKDDLWKRKLHPESVTGHTRSGVVSRVKPTTTIRYVGAGLSLESG